MQTLNKCWINHLYCIFDYVNQIQNWKAKRPGWICSIEGNSKVSFIYFRVYKNIYFNFPHAKIFKTKETANSVVLVSFLFCSSWLIFFRENGRIGKFISSVLNEVQRLIFGTLSFRLTVSMWVTVIFGEIKISGSLFVMNMGHCWKCLKLFKYR